MKHTPAPTPTQQRIIAYLVDHPRSTRREISENLFYTYSHVWQTLRGMRAYVTKHKRCYPVLYSAKVYLNWNARTGEVMAE